MTHRRSIHAPILKEWIAAREVQYAFSHTQTGMRRSLGVGHCRRAVDWGVLPPLLLVQLERATVSCFFSTVPHPALRRSYVVPQNLSAVPTSFGTLLKKHLASVPVLHVGLGLRCGLCMAHPHVQAMPPPPPSSQASLESKNGLTTVSRMALAVHQPKLTFQ